MGQGKKAVVTIEPSWSRWEDAQRALHGVREKFGDPHWTKPRGWVWHHAGELGKIQLVPGKMHGSLPHTGGFAKYHPREQPPVLRQRGASPFPLRDSYAALTVEKIERFEEVLEAGLPGPYRDFILQWNGGQPRVQGFRGETMQDEMLDYFLCIASGEEESIPNYLANYAERLPAGILPIAYDVFGNLICLRIKGPVTGEVLFWDHELEPEPDDPKDYNVTGIAASFDAFLHCFFEA